MPYSLLIPNSERIAGQTKWCFGQLVRYSRTGPVNFSQAPRYLVSWLGLLMTAVSFAALLFVAIRRLLFGAPVPGWASTVCIILFISGFAGQYLTAARTATKNHYASP